jgi:CheY-like chemotaxis protein
VQSATDGAAAIACLETHHFDLLVLDLMMPRTDGFGVLAYLAARGPDRPRIIVMSAAVPALVEQVPKDLVAGFISKPFNLAALLDLAEDACGNAGLALASLKGSAGSYGLPRWSPVLRRDRGSLRR